MGAWNTSLYGNDTARDVKGDYVHKLRSGKSDQEAMEAMLVEYERTKDDEDEGPLFWLALADTQWEYGRLTEPVREKALQLLAQGVDQERWSEAGAEKLEAWNETCRALGEKLRSPQPPRKRIRPYKLYQCPWSAVRSLTAFAAPQRIPYMQKGYAFLHILTGLPSHTARRHGGR